MKIALLCGGPSLERGISLNSARSVLDHLGGDDIEIVPFYFDFKKRAYKISKAQLYSNTPSDFDFKLAHTARPLSQREMIDELRKTDIVFPAMHGSFAEDGTLQKMLERHNIPFVGSPSMVCKKMFDKYVANEYIKQQGFFTLPSEVLKIYHDDHKKILTDFFKKHAIKRAIVKPANGGSSIGVFSVSNVAEALEKVQLIFSKRMDTRVVVEPFAEGIEFTSIIFQNRFGIPVAILPTEISVDYTEHQIFDFRKKYLPTRQVTYHCPPSFDNDTIEKIQIQAEQLFAVFGMHDFARFDGWVLNDGNIWFSDFNPMSGMEQNSFLFQQTSRIGMSHRDALRYIVKNACERQGVSFPDTVSGRKNVNKKKPVSVLFGGETSERQVSLMSGTNVWLKLRQSDIYEPKPFLLDTKGSVWELPYAFTLNHTVEEIAENCEKAEESVSRLRFLEERVQKRLGLQEGEATQGLGLPRKITLEAFLDSAAFVFLALHGGDGESGILQKKLLDRKIPHNGSNEEVSRLCMDKWKTGEVIDSFGIKGVLPILKKLASTAALSKSDIKAFWKSTCGELNAKTLIVKPRSDGCSSGIVHLYSSEDLEKYLAHVFSGTVRIPSGTFRNQTGSIEMPSTAMEEILFEKFVDTDVARAKNNMLKHRRKTGWIEVTVGVLEHDRKITVFNPSMTVAEGEVLTVEEKFQGGTGINITPLPEAIVSPKAALRTKELVGEVARRIGIQGYVRIDLFMNIDTGNIMVIELNSLPALTPSTVLYQQALAEKSPIYPRELLERIIKNSGY